MSAWKAESYRRSGVAAEPNCIALQICTVLGPKQDKIVPFMQEGIMAGMLLISSMPASACFAITQRAALPIDNLYPQARQVGET